MTEDTKSSAVRGVGSSDVFDSGAVVKRWIIIQVPGLVPEKKRPIPQTSAGVEAMLRDLYRLRPGAILTVAELTWNQDLWVSSGKEVLAIADAATQSNAAVERSAPPLRASASNRLLGEDGKT